MEKVNERNLKQVFHLKVNDVTYSLSWIEGTAWDVIGLKIIIIRVLQSSIVLHGYLKMIFQGFKSSLLTRARTSTYNNFLCTKWPNSTLMHSFQKLIHQPQHYKFLWYLSYNLYVFSISHTSPSTIKRLRSVK